MLCHKVLRIYNLIISSYIMSGTGPNHTIIRLKIYPKNVRFQDRSKKLLTGGGAMKRAQQLRAVYGGLNAPPEFFKI